MTDLERPRHGTFATVVSTAVGTVIVLAVLIGQAGQIGQLKELNAYTRAETEAARLRHEKMVRDLTAAIERNDAAIAASRAISAENRAALARLAPRPTPPRPIRPMPTPKPAPPTP